jgi:4-hydroxymandelate oxidase
LDSQPLRAAVAATIARVDEALSDLIPAYELAARANMPRAAFDYFAGGAGDETSLEESRVAWHRHRLRPRAFPGGAAPDLAIDVLETHVAMPVIVAPTAWHQLAHPAGEVETAAGVSAAGGLMVVATRSTMVIEEIAAALSGPWWYQVYVVNERRITEELVRRAVGLGAKVLMLTADTPYLGFKRRQDIPPVSIEQHLANFGRHLGSDTVAEDVAHSIDQDPSINFETIAWLRDIAGVPVLVKGVLRGDDAAACLDAGAAGVVVSNHGGRQLDRAIAPAVALPEVVAAVEGRGPVLVDGGVRSGTDVLIALALGATATMVGRPVLWALAAQGAAGVQRLLEGFRNELAHAMGLAGASTIERITRDLLA